MSFTIVDPSPPPDSGFPRLYRLEEVSKILNTPLNTIRYWRNMGQLRVVKLGKHPLVTASEITRFIESKTEGVRP